MRLLFDLATALFAFAAAIFWWWSAARTLPTMLTYWDAVPASDAYRQAVEHSAWLNSVAAFLSGCAALCAFLRAVGDWWARR